MDPGTDVLNNDDVRGHGDQAHNADGGALDALASVGDRASDTSPLPAPRDDAPPDGLITPNVPGAGGGGSITSAATLRSLDHLVTQSAPALVVDNNGNSGGAAYTVATPLMSTFAAPSRSVPPPPPPPPPPADGAPASFSHVQRYAAPPAHAQVAAPSAGTTSSMCDHDTPRYASAADVPVRYCALCDCVTLPDIDDRVPHACVVPVPHSARRDARLAELVAMHNEYASAQRETMCALAARYATLLARVEQWRARYASGAPIDYAAHDHPAFRLLAADVRRDAAAATAAARRATHDALVHRALFADALRDALPRTEAAFVSAARRLIRRAHPVPLYYPDLDGVECSVCGADARVRLHRQTPRYDTQRMYAHGEAAGTRRVPLPACRCRRFSMCVDCVLAWYWSQTNALRGTFARCPTCRAEFTLDDIVPVAPLRERRGGGDGGAATTAAAASANATITGQIDALLARIDQSAVATQQALGTTRDRTTT